MFRGQNLKVTAISIALILISCPSGMAQKVEFAAQQDHPYGGQPPAEQASSRLTPLSHSTDYSTDFAPYNSFMQSPYGTGVPAPYGTQYVQNPGPPRAAITQGAQSDPLMGSEVSPYSKYSPYLEVVGEGSDYTLGIDDIVTVIVRNQPDFSGRYVIDPEGNIQYNFVGDVSAVGKTKEELKAELVERLKEFVRYPEVAVMISEYRSKAVYVFGFVGRPGKYAMKGDRITIKEAIVAAGMPRIDGALKRVYVVRPSEYSESGQAKQKKVDLKKLLYKGDSAEDFVLEPGDTVIVNQRYFDKFVNNFSRLVGPLFQAASVYELGFGSKSGGFFNSDN